MNDWLNLSKIIHLSCLFLDLHNFPSIASRINAIFVRQCFQNLTHAMVINENIPCKMKIFEYFCNENTAKWSQDGLKFARTLPFNINKTIAVVIWFLFFFANIHGILQYSFNILKMRITANIHKIFKVIKQKKFCTQIPSHLVNILTHFFFSQKTITNNNFKRQLFRLAVFLSI